MMWEIFRPVGNKRYALPILSLKPVSAELLFKKMAILGDQKAVKNCTEIYFQDNIIFIKIPLHVHLQHF